MSESKQNIDANGNDIKNLKTYKVRWYILVMFSINVILQSVEMLIYQAVPSVVVDLYKKAHIDSSHLNKVLSLGSLSFFVFVFVMFIIDGLYDSLRLLTLLSAVSLFIQCIIRLLPHWIPSFESGAFGLILAAQILNQLGCAFCYSLPSRVSGTWFPSSERGVVTGITSQVSATGCALSFLIVPLAAQTTTGFVYMLYALFGLHTLCMLAIIIYFPARPKTPPSYSEVIKDEIAMKRAESENQEAVEKKSLGKRFIGIFYPLVDVFKVLFIPQFFILFIISAIHCGALQGLAANFPLLLEAHGMSTTNAGFVAFGHMIASIIGGILKSFFMQKCIKHARITYFLEFFLCTGLLALLVFLMPFGKIPEGKEHADSILNSTVGLCITIIVLGIVAGMPVTFFFECGSNIAFPASDSITGGLITAATSLGYFAVPYIFSFVGEGYMVLVAASIEALNCIVVFFLRVRANRTIAEEEEAEKLQGEDGTKREPTYGTMSDNENVNVSAEDMLNNKPLINRNEDEVMEHVPLQN